MADPTTRVLIAAAAGAYAANTALGSAVRLRVLDTSGSRWVHHALYVATMTTTAAAALIGASRGSTAGVVLAPALLPLAFLPFLGRDVHATTALAAVPWYAGALLLRRR